MINILKFHEFKISVLHLFIVGVIIFIFIFHLDMFLSKNSVNKIHNFSEKCVIKCTDDETCKKINNYRDSGYYLFDDNSDKCIITKWEISHFIMHAFLGYLTNIYVSTSLSIGFEIFEHYKYNCGSYLDLLYNFSGFLTGYYIRHNTLIL